MSGRRPEHARELRSYRIGFALALLLTAVAFALVASGGLATVTAWSAIAVLALAQIVVHFRFFLHIDLSEQKREDLQLILFSVLLVVIMGGGTIWILYNLHARMM
jgi:cytochrome o ubiquinol oxidase operon protein cyoD